MYRGAQSSWRFLSQLRHSNGFSSLSHSPAHLGSPRSRLHGLFSSSSCLQRVYVPPSFSSAAEPAHVANSADPEAFPSVESISGMEAASAAMATDLEGEQVGSVLGKILEEHRELVRTLRAELEEHKTLTQSIHDRISVLKLNKDEETAEGNVAANRQIQSEWTAFVEYLHSCDFFQDENNGRSVGSASTFDDPAQVKRAVYKFSQAHSSVFESLSPIDLRIIARHGCTDNDIKAAASQKRLRQFFKIEDASSDADTDAKPAVTQPKLSDVTRLLYSTILEGSFGDEVKSAISHLLREVISLSRKSSVMPSPTAEAIPSSKPSALLSQATQKFGTVKVEEATKITTRIEAAKPEASGAPAPPWKCPRCSFMNLDGTHRCNECSRRRPQQTYQLKTEKNIDEASEVEHVSEAKVPVDRRSAKKAIKRKDNLPSPSAQVLDNMKNRSSSSAIQAEDSTGLEDSSTEAEVSSDGSEAFSVLDDILESEDSDDEAQEGKQITLSDDSEEDKQGKDKRAPLSKLFPKLETPVPRRDNQRGPAVRNRDKFPNGKRFDDEDGIRRSKFGSLGVDEQEGSENDNAPPHRSRRGLGSRDDDFARRRGGNRGGGNRFQGRDGPNYGGGPGDSHEKRRNDGGPRGGSTYGSRDGGGRSSSFGSRSQRGKSAF